MSEWGFENDGNAGLGNTNGEGPKALRDAYEAMKKENAELRGELTSFLEEQRAEKMAKVFESLGVPGAQNVYQGEANPEKAKAWVESMQAVFGNGQPPAATTEQQATEPKLPPSMQAQFERLSQAGSDGQPLGNVEAAQAAVNDASDPQALIRAFQQMNI